MSGAEAAYLIATGAAAALAGRFAWRSARRLRARIEEFQQTEREGPVDPYAASLPLPRVPTAPDKKSGRTE